MEIFCHFLRFQTSLHRWFSSPLKIHICLYLQIREHSLEDTHLRMNHARAIRINRTPTRKSFCLYLHVELFKLFIKDMSCCPSHTQTYTSACARARAHTHIHSFTLSHARARARTLKHTHAPKHTRTRTNTLYPKHTHTHTLTHSYTQVLSSAVLSPRVTGKGEEKYKQKNDTASAGILQRKQPVFQSNVKHTSQTKTQKRRTREDE